MDVNKVGKEVFAHLTANANENGVRDNPSPYVSVGGRWVDIGHAFLGLDALLHPETGRPYTTYGIKNIDAASWIADLALAVYWANTYERSGEPDAPGVVVDLFNKLRTRRVPGFDDFYEMSAPESDLLGDADAFGLFSLCNGRSLSQLLADYYLGEAPGFSQRWRIFCGPPNDFRYKIKQDNGEVIWADGYTQNGYRGSRECVIFLRMGRLRV